MSDKEYLEILDAAFAKYSGAAASFRDDIVIDKLKGDPDKLLRLLSDLVKSYVEFDSYNIEDYMTLANWVKDEFHDFF